jgi:hypothetical protein
VYYNKFFLPIRKENNKEFVFLKYFTDDGKGNNEESEDIESKDLLPKEIEVIFKNGYFYKHVA